MGFISAYLEHTREYESPTSFWQWSAFSAISAVMRDNCYRKYGDSKLFPNIYVLLLAESAMHRKDRPVKTCEHLVRKVNNTKVISGRATIQAIQQDMVMTETDPKTGRLVQNGGSSILIAEEMSASLVDDPESVKMLTQMYDFRELYELRHIGQGKRNIKNLVFSIFGASNETLLRNLFSSDTLQGGLLGRTFIIKPNEERPPNSLILDTPEQIAEKERRYLALPGYLQEIASLRGEIVFEDDAKQEYNSWYNSFRLSVLKNHDNNGVLGRIHTGVLKIAMILTADKLKTSVCKCDIEEAIDLCTGLLPNYRNFMVSVDKNPMREAKVIVLQAIYGAPGHEIGRRELLQKHLYELDIDTLDKVVITFEQGGLLQQISQGGGRVAYRLTQKCLDIMGGK